MRTRSESSKVGPLDADSKHEADLRLASNIMDAKRAELLDGKFKSLNETLARRNFEVQELQSMIDSLREKNETLENHLSMSRESYNAMQVFVNQLKTERESLQNKIKQAEDVVVSDSGETKKVAQLVEEYKELLKKVATLSSNSKNDADTLNSTSHSFKSHQNNHDLGQDRGLTRKMNQEEGFQEGRSFEMSQLRSQNQALERENNELQERLDEAVEKIFMLESTKVADMTVDGDILGQNWERLENLLREKTDLDIPECSE